MISILAPTRITLALDIIRKLDQGPFKGYHELGIVKHQIDLSDILYIEKASAMSLECENEMVPCDERNICWRAAELIKSRFGIGDSVRIIIEKRIPVMGGLAGGSANAAAMLKALNQLWDLHLSKEQLSSLGRELGMDVPFFFTGHTAYDSESTGILEPIPTDLQMHFVLAIPEFGVSTKDAYGALDYSKIGKNTNITRNLRAALEQNNIHDIDQYLHNDFEISVYSQYPRLREIRDKLLKAGCSGAVMSGSGSTILGVVPDKETAEKVASTVDCRSIVTRTLGH